MPPLTPFAARLVGHKRVALLDASATALVELRQVKDHWVYSMDTTVKVAVLQRRFHDCALLRQRNGRLEPVEYVHLDESDPRHSVHTLYDWDAGTASTVRGSSRDPLVVPIHWPTWDPLSFQAAAMSLARQRPAGSFEAHQLLSKGSLDDLRVDFVGPLAAGAPGGAQGLATWKITTTRPGGTHTLLLSPEHGWRLFRITIDDVTLEWDRRALPAPAPSPAGTVPRCRGQAKA